jgi:hypothetical protein
MSDWQVGDLAVCVEDRPCRNTGLPNPCELGRIYRVEAVVVSRAGVTGLLLEGVRFPSPTIACWHGNFRKIRPDKHEDCEPEFVTLLKRRKVSA